jgi:hypothetical protein
MCLKLNFIEYDKFLYDSIIDESELDIQLEKRNYKKYVNFGDGVNLDMEGISEKFPFIRRFGTPLSYDNVNKYLNCVLIDWKKGNVRNHYYVINKIINEYYRKKKRIIEIFLESC